MSTQRRIFPLLAIVLGGAGVVACGLGILGTWWLGSRASEVVERGFAMVDSSCATAQQKIADTKEKIRVAKIASQDIQQSVKNWSKNRATERLGKQLGIDEKTNRLAAGLREADHWLEFSESSIQVVVHGLELAQSVGIPIGESPDGDNLLTQIAALRTQLSDASESVTTMRDRLSGRGAPASRTEKIDRAVALALRVVATLTAVDSRLADVDKRLAVAKISAQELKAKSLRTVTLAAISVTVLILWMAAGQIALFRIGWRKLCQGAHPCDNAPAILSTQ